MLGDQVGNSPSTEVLTGWAKSPWKLTIPIHSHFKGKEIEVWRGSRLLSLSSGNTSSRETSVML